MSPTAHQRVQEYVLHETRVVRNETLYVGYVRSYMTLEDYVSMHVDLIKTYPVTYAPDETAGRGVLPVCSALRPLWSMWFAHLGAGAMLTADRHVAVFQLARRCTVLRPDVRNELTHLVRYENRADVDTVHGSGRVGVHRFWLRKMAGYRPHRLERATSTPD